MKRKEVRDLKERLDHLDSNIQERRKKIDKMSLHFIVPLILFFVIVGALLIWLENLVTTVASCVIAVGLLLIGAWLTARYFRSETARRLSGTDLAFGLILLLTGILLFISPRTLEYILPSIWGLALVFGGFLKIQYAFDEKSVDVRRWWIMLIFAGVSLVIGVLALLNKSVFGENQHMAIGIFMLGEAVLDLTTYLLLTHGMKKQAGAQAAGRPASAAPAAEIPPASAAPDLPESTDN